MDSEGQAVGEEVMVGEGEEVMVGEEEEAMVGEGEEVMVGEGEEVGDMGVAVAMEEAKEDLGVVVVDLDEVAVLVVVGEEEEEELGHSSF